MFYHPKPGAMYGTARRKLDKNLRVTGKIFACMPYSTRAGACARLGFDLPFLRVMQY